MANNENLIPQAHKLTVEEASRGGKKSVEVRRKKKTLREDLEFLLESINKKTGETYQESITAGMIANAIDKTKGGNPEAYKLIAKMLRQYEDKDGGGETKEPTLNINITTSEDLKEEFYKDDE